MDFLENHGGKYWNVALGLTLSVPAGVFAGNTLSLEWQQPIRNDVNGFRRERDGTLSASGMLHFPQPGMEIDFSGVVKEYAVDRAATLCLEQSIRHGMINFGGDIRVVEGTLMDSPQ